MYVIINVRSLTHCWGKCQIFILLLSGFKKDLTTVILLDTIMTTLVYFWNQGCIHISKKKKD